MPLPDFLPGRFALARGAPHDYFALEHFHYLPRRPATYADVWVVRYAEFPCDPRGNPPKTSRFAGTPAALHFGGHDALDARWRNAARLDSQSAASQKGTGSPFLQRNSPRRKAGVARGRRRASIFEQPPPSGGGYSDCRESFAQDARVVAVGVLSFPSFRSIPRERVLGLRGLSHVERLRFTNAHVRTVSRVVVHPQFRSLGLASELVRKLIAVCPTRYVEASAVMARVHPFFESAGMRRVPFDGAQGREVSKKGSVLLCLDPLIPAFSPARVFRKSCRC